MTRGRVSYRVSMFVGAGGSGAAKRVCAVWFPGEERARSFAVNMLLDVYRELVVKCGDPRLFWCELASGWCVGDRWRPVGGVRVASLDNDSGRVDWAGPPALPRPRRGSA